MRAEILPPSLSLPSLQAVSMEVSHPAPRQPSWHTQYQPLLPRVHLPLPLHRPGQPSAQENEQSSKTGQTTINQQPKSHKYTSYIHTYIPNKQTNNQTNYSKCLNAHKETERRIERKKRRKKKRLTHPHSHLSHCKDKKKKKKTFLRKRNFE